MKSINHCTFAQFAQFQAETKQLIDCRDSNAFNGWSDNFGPPLGHVPDAINIDPDWLIGFSTDQLVDFFASYGLKTDLPTWLYGEQGKIQRLASLLESSDFQQIICIQESVTKYPDKLEYLPRYQYLVPVNFVHELVQTGELPNSPNSRCKIIEVGSEERSDDYLRGHIPSALYLNSYDIEALPFWKLLESQKLASVIEQLGISVDTCVILYSRHQLAAARVALMMIYMGINNVRLLNGGWQAWLAAGYQIEAGLNKAQTVNFEQTLPSHPEYILTLSDVTQLLTTANSVLACVRSKAEFEGQTSGYCYLPAKGRIRDSIWGGAGNSTQDINDFLNPDGTMKSAHLIKTFWTEQGILPAEQICFYCGTAWRASNVWFFAYVMGLDNISIYDGGWCEWSFYQSNTHAKSAL